MKRRAIAVLFLVTGLCSMATLAQQDSSIWDETDFEIAPFLGLRLGGEMSPLDRVGGDLGVEEDLSVGVAVDIDMWENAQLEFLYSHASTDVETPPSCDCGRTLDMTVEYLHVGWLNYWDWRQTRTFLVTSGGVTLFDSNPGSFAESTALSAAVGGGFKVPLSNRVAMRFDARVFATFVDEEDLAFCDRAGSCLMRHSDTVFWQYEATAGILFGFSRK